MSLRRLGLAVPAAILLGVMLAACASPGRSGDARDPRSERGWAGSHNYDKGP